LNIANILSIAGAKPQAFTRGEASYGRKRRNAGEEEEINTEEEDVSETTTTEKTESKLPESYVGRFKGLNIASILSIAGAKPQAFTRGEASYGRKRRNTEDDENVSDKNEEIPDAMADQMTEIENVQALWMEFLQHGISSRRKRQEEANDDENDLDKNREIPDSLAFQLDDIENVQALWLEFLQHGISSRRKRQEEAKGDENVEVKNEEIPDAMADQMTEIENVQALWMEFLQHGISSRRKRQNDIEATDDNQGKVIPSNTKITVPIQVKVKNWGETGIESQVVGDNRKKRESVELLKEGAIQDNDDSNSKPLEVKVKYWGETGIQSPKNEVKNRRKKRQSLEFNLEEAIENESIMQDIFQATDDLNVINIPIKIVEVKNWGETGIQKPSDSI